MMQCMFTDNYDSSFYFWVFEKMLTQKNCLNFYCLTFQTFMVSVQGGRGGGQCKILIFHTRSRVVSAMERVRSKNLYTNSFTGNEL